MTRLGSPLSSWLAAASLALVACGPSTQGRGPEAASGAGQKLSDRGLYRASLRPTDGEPPLNRLHTWALRLETKDGEPFIPALLSVDGGMPQHSHGFVTAPRATGMRADGDILIEGVKSHKPGEWPYRFGFVGPAGPDAVTFVVEVHP